MPSIADLLGRFRRASRDTFNAHFLPYAEIERDYEVFRHVERAMFQVLFLPHLGISARYGEPSPTIRFKPVRDGVTCGLQGPGGGVIELDRRCVCSFMEFFDSSGIYGAWELDLVRGEIADHPDALLRGREVLLAWEDVEVLQLGG